MNIIEKSIKELTPYENNPRKNEAAVPKVAKSIEKYGFKVPIVIDKDGVIVCGHTRLLAAKSLKMKTVPCIVADDLTPEQIKEFRLVDNKTAEIAEWDFEKLELELSELDFPPLDLNDFGFSFDEDESEKIAEEDNFEEEIPEEPKAKLGDIYQLGNHRLMCGDATNSEDVVKLMNGAKASMIFTDPPYDDETAKRELWEPAFKNMAENAEDYCSLYVTMPQGGAHMMMMMMMAAAASWQIKHELIWVKNNHVLGRTDYYYKHEPILFGWKEKHKFYGKGEFDKSVWEIPKPQKSDLHPTMKPIALISNTLLNSSKENDTIMDLFGGSGSTLIACEQLGRKCYMMELEPKYIDVIIARWEKFTGQKARLIRGDEQQCNATTERK